MSAASSVVFTVQTIRTTSSDVKASIDDIRNIKSNIANIRANIKILWKGESNNDSDYFALRMEELDADITKMEVALQEYAVFMDKSAVEFEQKQQAAIAGARNLRRPTAS